MKQRDEALVREIVAGCVDFGEVELGVDLVCKLVRRCEWAMYSLGYEDCKEGRERLDARVLKEDDNR